ncbi:MAG TPA: L-rhamnose mutarotase [Puia sp.]|nr:L-rhamnose mutarotase [Puia sp.]
MQRIAFTMQLFPGYEAEYRQRHANIWPELQSLLKEAGITEYSIFLDEKTLLLFAYMVIEEPANLNRIAGHPVMRRWWDRMKDIMESYPDGSPIVRGLEEVFYLP